MELDDESKYTLAPSAKITSTIVLDTDVIGNALVLCILDDNPDYSIFAVVADYASDMTKWGPHAFYVTLPDALSHYPYDPITDAKISWNRSDFEQVLTNFGIIPSDNEVFALMRQVHYLKPWKDNAISDGWKTLDRAIIELHPDAVRIDED